MPYLVDGDNLLGTWRGRRRSDSEKRRLAFELDRFAARSRRRVVVVFDGTPPPGGVLGPDVRFAGREQSADDVILSLLRQERDPAGWIVVTSDRSLRDRCRWLGARAVASDRFRHKLTARDESEKPEAEVDVAYWLEQFGEEP